MYIDGLAVTGSYAAQRFVHVAVGGQLMLYVAPWLDIDDVADELGLLPVTDGADVLLLNEPDDFVRRRAEFVDGALRSRARCPWKRPSLLLTPGSGQVRRGCGMRNV